MDNYVIPSTGEIVTYTGVAVDPINITVSDIDIEDIAHALGNSCRFTGHVRFFYSVAQHSVLCSHFVSPEYALWALLHDASEAYLSDIARPLKYQPGFGDTYRTVEYSLMEAICRRFGLNSDMPPEVKFADEVLLANEIVELMPQHELFEKWTSYSDDFPVDIQEWLPGYAKQAFLDRYRELGGTYA